MKKALPILFVASTVVVTAASLTVATNGGFTQLRAANNEVPYSITFTKNDIVSSSITEGGTRGTVSLSKKTASGFDFGTTATVYGGYNGYVYFDTSHMIETENIENEDDASIQMEFEFHNVVSAVSVTLNGSFDDDRIHSHSFTNSTEITDGFKILVSLTYQLAFNIDNIVVQYTCSY